MKGISRKIALSVLALVLTLAATLTGAYAWFVINNTAEVKGLKGEVQAGEGGFMIQAATYDSENGNAAVWSKDKWKTTLVLSDIDYRVGGGTEDKLAALSYKNGFYGWNAATATNQAEVTTSGYIEFDLAFAANSQFSQIDLSGITIESEGDEWAYETAGFTPSDVTDVKIDGQAKDAARVGFFGGTNVTTPVVAQLGDTFDFGTLTTNTAVKDYNKLAKAGAKITAIGAGFQEGNVEALSTGLKSKITELTTTFTDATAKVDGYANYGIVTVRIWIEGWDQEAFNGILEHQLTVGFTLTAK